MGLFRRRAKGRHALGAAVTSIPSGPPVPVQAPPVPLATRAADASGREPDLMTSIAQLIATGEAWVTGAEPRSETHPEPPPAAQTPAEGPAAPPTSPGSARSSLEEALSDLLPIFPDAPQGVQPPRVQLGFRDGSTTTLEPGSTHSLALEQLARSLAGRD